MIALVDYGASNIRSVLNAIADLGEEAQVVTRPEALAEAKRIILPGVGAMAPAVERLRAGGLDEALNEAVRERGVPFLGICLGMQMMCRRGYEGDVESEGLGWLDGEVVRLEPDPPQWRVPNMGWSEVTPNGGGGLFEGLRPDSAFYFCHSYHARLRDPSDMAASVDFHGPVTAAVWRGNAMGVQFHPERSGAGGLRLLESFLDWDGSGRAW